jgi:diguanylate cyclase (GGDEF)-like protein
VPAGAGPCRSHRWCRGVAALVAALLLLLVAAPASATAPAAIYDGRQQVPLAPHVDVLVDPAGKLAIADVAAPGRGDFVAAPDGTQINFGYSPATFWLRFTVAPERNDDALVEVAFPSLDSVALYVPDGAGGHAARVTGDLLPFADRPSPHRNFVFPVRFRAGEAQTFYLRIASAGTLTVPLALWPRSLFDGADRAAYSALALYFGMLVALALYNAMVFFSLRDPSYAAYVAFALAMAVGQASLTGFGNQFLWPAWPAWGNVALPFGFAATGFFGALFTRLFLATRRTVPRFDRAIFAHMVAFALLAVGVAFLPYRDVAVLTSLAGASFALTAVFAGLACLRRDHPGARYFMLAWTVLLFGVLVLALRNLDLLPTNFVTLHAMLIGSALEMLLLSFALARRVATLDQDKQRVQADALAAARRSERELEAKVGARTGELAASNQRLAEALSALERIASTDRLTGAWNRHWLDEAARREIERARRYGTPLSLLMIDVDGFKRINDRHGHAAGDDVLARIAGRLRAEIRATDSLTRWGGEEFIVLAPGTPLPGAATLAENLRRRIEQLALAGIGPVTISVGVGEYRAGQRFEDLIAAADAAMYAAKRAGRNRVDVAGERAA